MHAVLAAATTLASAGNLFLQTEIDTSLTTKKTVDGAGNWWQMTSRLPGHRHPHRNTSARGVIRF